MKKSRSQSRCNPVDKQANRPCMQNKSAYCGGGGTTAQVEWKSKMCKQLTVGGVEYVEVDPLVAMFTQYLTRCTRCNGHKRPMRPSTVRAILIGYGGGRGLKIALFIVVLIGERSYRGNLQFSSCKCQKVMHSARFTALRSGLTIPVKYTPSPVVTSDYLRKNIITIKSPDSPLRKWKRFQQFHF